MGLFLYILLFIFIYYVIKVALKFYDIYRKIHNATKQFRNFDSHENVNHYKKQNSSNNNTTTTSTGEIIEDRRTEDEINRKIFTQEEGEYVDFEEE